MKILIIEDSERLRRSLGDGLRKSGHAVDLAADGSEGLAFLDSYAYDVVILDLMLPGVSGLDTLTAIRERGSDVHVLILSAKDQAEDRVRGLNRGADDYLIKPFDFDELCARLDALLRRRVAQKCPRLAIGPLILDTTQREVRRAGVLLKLTRSEFALFEVLALRRGQTFSKDQLLDLLHPGNADVTTNVVEVLISTLRKKIDLPGGPATIKTRRGYGYLIERANG